MAADSKIKVELACDAQAQLGEGPVWDARDNSLYWVDILSHRVHVHHREEPASDGMIELAPYVSSIVPRRSGGFALTLQDGFYVCDSAGGGLTRLAEVEASVPGNRFNDGKCDPAGRFVAGTMSMNDEPGRGALYSLDAGHAVETLVQDVSISNGLAWSGDGATMYYIDTPTQRVVAFDYDTATGAVANRRVVVEMPTDEGSPDGMTIDAEGMLWIAHWGGWQVSRWDPATGEKLLSVPVPASQVTSCAFGGERLDRLYITTARVGLGEAELAAQPHAGGLFCADVGVRGLPAAEYVG
ncbi:SMP-30/gluconolactonase/LRE family protein [Cohnella ginsengisoli]|uniref:Regucalcin n=1 Tax=Cohnella ginsengisoli TaxID=425004 RepID=A0A9X4KI67_9BACL|nr:SMP-30/gluconolactonase/LRE family protein [Cohnella ginsengisoli]MDG0792689.1 SMP-30/gluconolactonase/LRE family protein [Cohnella ginsengisoli]